MRHDPAEQDDQYYILNTSTRLDDRKRVLKHGDTFAVFDRYGNVEPFGRNEFGMFHQDTRFLSRLVLRLTWRNVPPTRMRLLGSAVQDDNALLTIHLTNPDIDGGMRQGTLHVLRTQALWRATLFDRLRVHNYGDEPVEFDLVVDCGADYADIFEVRGMTRDRQGKTAAPRVGDDWVRFGYRGLDGRTRRTHVRFDPRPTSLEETGAVFALSLAPRAAAVLQWSVQCEVNDTERVGAADTAHGAAALSYPVAAQAVRTELAAARAAQPKVFTSNAQFNQLLTRSRADLHMLTTHTPWGDYPCAGVPWFSTPFGRDGLITALQCLWLAPDLARGVLSFLAATQAREENEHCDAQPGKILHEARNSEMALTGEVPFGRYYGSVDSTPLFVVLAAGYLDRTCDTEFLSSLWPNIERALHWIDHYGDADRDGFVEYARLSPRGLVHQGWKDSHDAVFHDDGAPAEPPIALCEVQGYVYAAKHAAARLAEALGHGSNARSLRAEARALRDRFEAAFWCEDLSTYALALDGRKKPCRVATSNAGHCLYTRIASAEHARKVAANLMAEPGFSGWGVRTVSSTASRYNPMSYHNGSVWPHDNALIAAGFARYGMQAYAARILEGMFEASLHLDLHRLPELFCGFTRNPGEGPTLYPQACSPQAWAAGAPLLCLQACLGLHVDAGGRKVSLHKPFLPDFLQQVSIEGLGVRDARLDLEINRHAHDVGVRLTRREGDVRVTVQM